MAVNTNNTKKAVEAQGISNLKDRSDYLRKWLHGTVGNYFLAVAKMGEYLRDQMVKTHLADDRLLPAGEKVELRMSRDRVTQLSAAKTKDQPANGGKGWDVNGGGEHFNALIEKFKSEDRGEENGDGEKKKRPTVKELTDRADVFKSPAIRNALLVATGYQEAGRALVDLDDRMHRLIMVLETLAKRKDEISDPKVKALVAAIIGDCPAGEVELCINALVG